MKLYFRIVFHLKEISSFEGVTIFGIFYSHTVSLTYERKVISGYFVSDCIVLKCLFIMLQFNLKVVCCLFLLSFLDCPQNNSKDCAETEIPSIAFYSPNNSFSIFTG